MKNIINFRFERGDHRRHGRGICVITNKIWGWFGNYVVCK